MIPVRFFPHGIEINPVIDIGFNLSLGGNMGTKNVPGKTQQT